MKRLIFGVAVWLAMVVPAHAQMFDSKGELIGAMDVLQCKEMATYKTFIGEYAHNSLGTYGFGYMQGHFEGVVLYLEAAPTTPGEQALAKKLRANFAAFTLSINIVAAHIETYCSIATHKDEKITVALQALVTQMVK